MFNKMNFDKLMRIIQYKWHSRRQSIYDCELTFIKAGYRNAVFAIRFFSDVKWGGTRITPHPKLGDIIECNMNLIREWHGSELADICKSSQNKDIVEVPNMVSEDEKIRALDAWERNRQQLQAFTDGKRKSHIFDRIKSVVKRVNR